MERKQESSEATNISYSLREVEIDTINGLPLKVQLWCSDVNPKTIKFVDKKVPSVFKCDICGKEFDENKKMLLHKNYHNVKK